MQGLKSRNNMTNLIQQNRRELLSHLGTLTLFLSLGVNTKAFAGSAGRDIPNWINRIDELSALLRGGVLSVANWRVGLTELFNQIDIQDILKDINFEDLKRVTKFADLGVATARIDLGKGVIRKLRFYPKLFVVGKGRAIIPHGHNNMVSAHLTLRGKFHLRQYDQLGINETHMLVRPSFDGHVGIGEVSSIGEAHDNVHWFVAQEPSYTLDTVITGLHDTNASHYDIYNLDMDMAQTEGDTLRVPRIGVQEALAKYG